MHFHLPKPLHGWREFVGEVGIIVVGVLIALGAEQVVEQLRWREKAHVTDQALTDELATSVLNASERLMLNQCARSRLGHLIMKVRDNRGDWAADPLQSADPGGQDKTELVPPPFRAPAREWSTSAWDSAKTSGILDHMDREKVEAYATAYALIDAEKQYAATEFATSPELLYLSVDTRLDDQARHQALSALGVLWAVNRIVVFDGEELIDGVRAMRLDFRHANLGQRLKDREAYARRWRGSCVRHVDPRL